MISIESIVLKNFRQFRNAELNFHDVNCAYFLVGLNGIGKSNLMNAVCWCLYDTTPFRSGSDKTTTDNNIVNNDAIREGEKEASVLIRANIEGVRYNIRRYTTTSLLLNPPQGKRSTLSVTKINENSPDNIPIENPELIIEQLLPKKISNLFIFDGETIKRLFDDNYHDNLRSEIYTVSNIDVINRAKNDIRNVINKYEKKKTADEKDADKKLQAEEELENYRNGLDELKAEIDRLKKEKDVLDVEQKSAMSELTNDQIAESKVRESETLENDISKLNNLCANIEKDITKMIADNFQYAITRDLASEYIAAIRKAVKEKKLPPDISTDALNDILESQCCICGNHLDEKSEQHIRSLLNDSADKEELSFVQPHSELLSSHLRALPSIGATLNRKSKELNDLYDDKDKKDKKLSILKKELEDISDKRHSGDSKARLKEINAKRDKVNLDLHMAKIDLEQRNTQIAILKETVSKLTNSSNINEKISLKIRQLENIERQLDKVEASILEKTRKSVEDGMTETYKMLHWKKDVQKISLSNEYRIKILFENGNEVQLKDLATGEKKMLGISIMNALSRRVANFDFPLFIDSPTEDLDTSVVPKVLSNIGLLSKNKQLFVTTLNRPEVDEFLKTIPNDKKYRLARLEGTETTIINEWS